MITGITLVVSAISLGITLLGLATKTAAIVSTKNMLKDLVDISKIDQIKGFDEAYTSIAMLALDMLLKFMNYARLLVLLCAFLALIFNCFKLWSGTLEIKKFYVDSIFKTLMVMGLMVIYPSVITKSFELATELGVEASGGYESVELAFGKMASSVKEIFNSGTNAMIEALKSGGAQMDENGNIILSDAVLKKFTDSGLSDEEAKQWAESKGLVVGDTKNHWYNWGQEAKKQKKAEKVAEKAFESNSKDASGSGFKNKSDRKKYMKQSLAIIDNLLVILTGTDAENLANMEESSGLSRIDILTMGDNALEKVFYNPYIGESKRISVSQMVKTAIVISEIASSGALAPLDTNDTEEEKITIKKIEDDNPRMVVKFIGFILKTFLYKLILVLGVLIIMVEYCVSAIEYFIVMSVSVLMIPFFLIDATKQYATNILKTIFSYFVKILVTSMMVFFVLTMYINMGTGLASMDLSSSTTMLYYIFTVFLGVVLAKGSGKIASAVISGNPSMGLGDVVNEMRGIGHMARTASHAVQDFGRDMGRAGYGVHKVGQAHGEAAAFRSSKNTLSKSADAAAQKHLDTLNSDPSMSSMTSEERQASADRVRKETMKQGMRELNKDAAFKAFTGKDRGLLDQNHKSMLVGSQQIGDDGRAEGITNRQSITNANDLAMNQRSKELENMQKLYRAGQDKDRKQHKNPYPEEGL